MHEYSVAMGIYETVLDVALKNNATKVISVDLELGELTHINPVQLSFCFEAVAKGSLLERTDLNVIKVAPEIRCKCGYEGSINTEQQTFYDLILNLRCPKCGNPAPELTSGREINVRDIKIEVDENA